MAKPGRDVGIIDAVSRADGEEAAVGPFSIWCLVGVLLLEVCDALFREEILLQNIDNRVSRLAYEECRRGEVGCGREVAPAEGVGVIDVLELKTEIALDGVEREPNRRRHFPDIEILAEDAGEIVGAVLCPLDKVGEGLYFLIVPRPGFAFCHLVGSVHSSRLSSS